MVHCVFCGGAEFVEDVVPDDITLDGVVYRDSLDASLCVQCGEHYFEYLVLCARKDRLVQDLEALPMCGPEATAFIKKWKRGQQKVAEVRAAYKAKQDPSCKM